MEMNTIDVWSQVFINSLLIIAYALIWRKVKKLERDKLIQLGYWRTKAGHPATLRFYNSDGRSIDGAYWINNKWLDATWDCRSGTIYQQSSFDDLTLRTKIQDYNELIASGKVAPPPLGSRDTPL